MEREQQQTVSHLHLLCCVYSGSSMEVQCFEIKTEADSNDSTLCSHYDKPSTGIFTVSDSRGLVVTSGALLEPSGQLIHDKCIDQEIKSNRTRTQRFTEPDTNFLKHLICK